jgi:hypothetical protein
MQWIICTKKVDCVDQEMTGPFETYDQAMAVFTTMMRPASDYEHKYNPRGIGPSAGTAIFA